MKHVSARFSSSPRAGVVLIALVGFGCSAGSPAAVPDAGAPSTGMPDALGPPPSASVPPEQFTPLAPDLLAKRLARFLWNEDEAPAALVARLAAQPLDGDRIAAIADEMLSDPRGAAGVRAFFHHWLNTNADVKDLAAWPPDARAEVEESAALGAFLTREDDGTYADLLSAPFTFVNETLAPRYGLTDVRGDEFRRVPYPPGQSRFGLLTGAGLLSRFSTINIEYSWPAKRSWLIIDQILCFPIPRTFLDTPPPDASRSIRQQMLDITSDTSCRACHSLLNSPGFAFNGFDTQGRWRPTPGHGPGETEGWIPASVLPDEPHFEGPEQLARLLISRPRATQCLASAWLHHGVDRKASIS
ncbi:MAG TPA: DUF1588 domain-containing protein, partial [Polyangia bacterium]